MAQIKYAPGITPVINEHAGYTFQPNRYGQSILSLQKNNRTRYSNQREQQQNLMKATRFWRDMPAEIKTNWNTFAATYPQASRRNPAKFLTGFQLFCKRCHYCFLNHGITTNFMEQPVAEILPAPVFNLTIENADNVVDVTELYIKNFGLLPSIGQSLLCRVFPMAEYSGQFFAPFETVLTVEAIYIDGMFVSFSFATPTPGITYSLYLSKPVNAGQKYVGTKIRYMGCFTPKSFLELTDTPDSYAGASGKTVIVKADESGIEFGEGGGGSGLTCETLINCPVIISIQNTLLNLSEVVSIHLNTSIPAIKYGLLYKWTVANDSRISSNPNFIVPEYVALLNWVTAQMPASTYGGTLKETGYTFWNSPNTGATNSNFFNGRGGGFRTNSGVFQELLNRMRFWNQNQSSATFGNAYYLYYSSALIGFQATSKIYGNAIRLVNPNTTKANGDSGIYIGNNGIIYRTIVINGWEWLADNLSETLFNDGTEIPEITDNTAWSLTTSPALCAYSNNWANV